MIGAGVQGGAFWDTIALALPRSHQSSAQQYACETSSPFPGKRIPIRAKPRRLGHAAKIRATSGRLGRVRLESCGTSTSINIALETRNVCQSFTTACSILDAHHNPTTVPQTTLTHFSRNVAETR